ncbi:IS110 family transposase [Anaerovorax odorimutans]|uniref:IS110 family transposase n=1 Tax=Anaerovorax odorimutans TaxID=109327 RepID=UPI002ED38D12
MNMNAVGINVAKGKSILAILCPYGKIVSSPLEIKHTSSRIKSLIEQIKSIDGESRIVMGHTGRYYEPLTWGLTAGLFITAVSPTYKKHYYVVTALIIST